jgi:hypothetical protein
MPPRAWQVLPLAAVFLVGDANAQDGPECFSPATKFNVCAQAREMQKQIAAALPMKTSANVTVISALAIGRDLNMNAMWDMTKADLEKSLVANGMTLAMISERISAATKNSVCSVPVTAAFVRLGGRISYTYRTTDHFHIAAVAVDNCPR